jgi:hypothetical protein
MSGLTLKEAESLLNKPDKSLTAHERFHRTLLRQAPAKRQAWKEHICRKWGALLPRKRLSVVGKMEINGEKLTFSGMSGRQLGSTDFGNRESLVFIDRKNGVVYKVFDMDDEGTVGTRFNINAEGLLDTGRGGLVDLVEKIYVINAIGGTPTEILGLTEDGGLVVKQPYGGGAGKISASERQGAAQAHGLVFVPNSVVRSPYRNFYTGIGGLDFLIGDLHPGNFHRDTFQRARILDIITARITDEYYRVFPMLNAFVAANRARERAPDSGAQRAHNKGNIRKSPEERPVERRAQ